jgi:hypothetical protein
MQQSQRDERPTLPPGFDVARYAKDSDAQLRRAEQSASVPPTSGPVRKTEEPRSETRIASRPEMPATLTDEEWARTVVGAPFCAMNPATLRGLPLDPRAAFLLSLMDGAMDIEVLAEISSMDRQEVLRTVRDLFDTGVVDFR